MKLMQVEDHPHLVKDMDSKALLNTDMAGLSAYKKRKMATQELEQRMDAVEGKLDILIELIKEKL